MTVRIAIDTGGTFTDLVLHDAQSGSIERHKIPSTPDDPGRALVDGVLQILAKANASADRLELLVHGTTVATNAVLQRRGAKVAFLTTRGFRDILQIQRQDRPKLYEMRRRRAEPLVPRAHRYEVTERILYDGSIQQPIAMNELSGLAKEFNAAGIESVAIGFLHSHTNAAHEQVAAKTIREQSGISFVSVLFGIVRRRKGVRTFQHLRDERLRAAGDLPVSQQRRVSVENGRHRRAAPGDEIQWRVS